MKYRIGITVLLAFGLMACGNLGGFNIVRGSGNVVTETRDVSGFTGVVLSWAGDMAITQGETDGLTIEAEDNILPLITTRVEGGKLIIGLADNVSGGTVMPTKPVKYNLQVKTLDSIDVSGAGNISAPSLKSDNLQLLLSGAGNVNLRQLDAEQLNANSSGAGNFTLAGQVDTQNVSLSGLGNYDAGDLRSSHVTVKISGAGNATVWAEQTLNAEISGAGRVGYYGSPQVTQQISGAGSITSLGNK